MTDPGAGRLRTPTGSSQFSLKAGTLTAQIGGSMWIDGSRNGAMGLAAGRMNTATTSKTPSTFQPIHFFRRTLHGGTGCGPGPEFRATDPEEAEISGAAQPTQIWRATWIFAGSNNSPDGRRIEITELGREALWNRTRNTIVNSLEWLRSSGSQIDTS
jgi:hypothetical protein